MSSTRSRADSLSGRLESRASNTMAANNIRYFCYTSLPSPGRRMFMIFSLPASATWARPEEDVGFDASPTAAGVRDLLSGAVALAPALEQAKLSHVAAGLRPAAPDRMPVLGP